MDKDTALRLALEALEKLWGIIDDIDTYGDMAKADEKLYRTLVERRQRQRFEETGISTDGYELHGGAITAIKAALANEALERKAENARELGLDYEPLEAKDEPWKPDDMAYRPNGLPQRTFVGLTDEEAQQTFARHNCTISTHLAGILARAIEAKLKEKNT
jgi:hypothetical protein